MDLNRNKWYVRWYFWSLEICEEFTENYGNWMDKEQNGTNLCAFMRTILIYAPLILLFHAVVYAGALAIVTILPIYLFGLKGYGLGVGVLVGFYIFVFLAISLGVWLRNKQKSGSLTKKQAVVNSDPSFVCVLGRWVVAKKRRICPLITFVKQDSEVQR